MKFIAEDGKVYALEGSEGNVATFRHNRGTTLVGMVVPGKNGKCKIVLTDKQGFGTKEYVKGRVTR